MSKEKKVTRNITIEDVKIVNKNFAGKRTDYNNAGNRNFCILLPDGLAEELMEEGWNVKHFRPREDDPDQYEQPFLNVKIKFDPYPPVVQLITSKGKIKLDEETIDQLDWSIIETADIIIRPYNYPATRDREAGVSAYVKALYVTIKEDELAKKYADVPDLDGDDLPVYEQEE